MNLSLDLGRLENTGSLGWDDDRSSDLLTLLGGVEALDFARGLDDEVNNLRLTLRLLGPDGRKEFTLSVRELVVLAVDGEKHILKLDVLNKLEF